MKAVVSLDQGKYSVEEVTLDPPKAGELKIRMAACGVCHSDLSVVNGILPLPKPITLGHEGAGYVDEIGEGVIGFERFGADDAWPSMVFLRSQNRTAQQSTSTDWSQKQVDIGHIL